MTAEERGQCLRAFRHRIGLENKSEAGRAVSKEKGFACDEGDARRSIGRHERGEVKPRDQVLSAWSAVASKRGYRRKSGKKTKVLLKDIFRIDSLEEWMVLLKELVDARLVPARMGLDTISSVQVRDKKGEAVLIPGESLMEVVHQDADIITYRCEGPATFQILERVEGAEYPRPCGKFFVPPGDVRHIALMHGFALAQGQVFNPWTDSPDDPGLPLDRYQPALERLENPRAKKA